MIAKNKKNRNKKKHDSFFLILFSLLILLVIGFFIYTNINIGQRRTELIKRINVLRNEIQALEQENQKLQEGIIRADSQDFLEEKAREELGLKKPGEEVIVVIPIEKEIEKTIEKEKSFWQKIWQRLGL